MILPLVPVESFFDSVLAADIWPKSISRNEIFMYQLKLRKELKECLDGVFDSLPRPDIPLETAIAEGYITEEQVTKLYTALSDLLADDRDYKRLILYLPFELLPNKIRHHYEKKLQQALERFGKIYIDAWKNLLYTHDVRANFVNGDVLEVERRIGDLPRVVKAAHLIPKLVQNGLLTVEEVVALMENSDDEILKNSIAAALSVVANIGAKTRKQKINAIPMAITLASVQTELDKRFSQIESEDFGDIMPRRKAWLKKKSRQETIWYMGEHISMAIVEDGFSPEVAMTFLTHDAKSASRQSLIEGIGKAIEFIASADFRKAQVLYTQYEATLLNLWKNDPETRETLSKTFRRFRQLLIIRDEQLAELNIVIPKLAGPFSENLKFMKQEMDEIRAMAASIEQNPELFKLIYPTVLIFGSRLNGYGQQDADIDLGVCVRPRTSFAKRARLKELLKKTFTHEKIRADEIVEFWLEEKNGRLKVRDFAESDVSLGQSYWTHVLFGAAGEEMRVFRKSVGALCTATATCLSAGRILFLVIRLLYQILIKISNALMIFAITPKNFSVAYWHGQV